MTAMQVGLRSKDLSEDRLRYVRQLGVEKLFVDMATPAAKESVVQAESQERAGDHCLTIRGGNVPTVSRLEEVRARLATHGLQFAGIHTLRPPMYDKIAFGEPGADQQLATIKDLVRNLGAAGVSVLGYQWMPDSVQRTAPEYHVRGDARATRFDLSEYNESIDRDHEEADFWHNYERFLDEVLPVAENAGVTLALHPADPPVVEKLNGVPRLFRNVDAFDRAVRYYPSEHHGLKLCLGCFSEMGELVPEIIRRFGESIVFVHFRDVVGTMPFFYETFLDDPHTNFDELTAIRALRDVGFEGAILPDHVPRMTDDSEWGHRGRGFTIGYLKGLIKSTA